MRRNDGMDIKFMLCEFEGLDGYPLAVDPNDIVAVTRYLDEETDEEATGVYTMDGGFWRVTESYIEAVQVWTEAKTNNLSL